MTCRPGLLCSASSTAGATTTSSSPSCVEQRLLLRPLHARLSCLLRAALLLLRLPAWLYLVLLDAQLLLERLLQQVGLALSHLGRFATTWVGWWWRRRQRRELLLLVAVVLADFRLMMGGVGSASAIRVPSMVEWGRCVRGDCWGGFALG